MLYIIVVIQYYTVSTVCSLSFVALITLRAYRTLLLSVSALLPLLGGTWILGLLFLIDDEQTSIVLAWVFTAVNSLQVSINPFVTEFWKSVPNHALHCLKLLSLLEWYFPSIWNS